MDTQARHFKPLHGFTMIEVLLVVVILAIIGGLAVPMLKGDETTKLREAARLLISDLGFAQIESISHSDDIRLIVFDTINNRYHVAIASDTATPLTHPIYKKPYQVTFGSGGEVALSHVTLGSLSVGGDNQLGFGIYGQLDQIAAATITLECLGRNITITVDPTSGEATISAVN